MDKYLEATEALLIMLQSTLTKNEMENSEKTSKRMYDAIRKISEEDKLNVREMLNATLAINYTILDIIKEELDKERKWEANFQ